MGKFNRISLIRKNDINDSTKCYTWRKIIGLRNIIIKFAVGMVPPFHDILEK